MFRRSHRMCRAFTPFSMATNSQRMISNVISSFFTWMRTASRMNFVMRSKISGAEHSGVTF